MSDLIKRSDAIKAIDDVFDGIPMEQTYEILKVRKIIRELSSADRPQGDSVSRRYLLAEIDDLADEFSEVDENGLHSERWCGILDSKGIIVNAPSVADRPQGEWIAGRVGHGPGYTCSLCNYGVAPWNNTPYCPNCGARMFAKDINVPNKEGADDETD